MVKNSYKYKKHNKQNKYLLKEQHIKQIKNKCIQNISKLNKKEFLIKRCNYEEYICKVFGWKQEKNIKKGRYYDAFTKDRDGNTIRIEFKKAQQQCWLNVVRYTEMFLKEKQHSQLPTITVFFYYKKNKNNNSVNMTDICIIDTETLINNMINKIKDDVDTVVDAFHILEKINVPQCSIGISKTLVKKLSSNNTLTF